MALINIRNIRNIIVLFTLPVMILMTGCYTDFTPDIDSRPVLCINSLITAGEPIEVDVTRSWMYTDVKGEKNHEVADAVVNVYANNSLVGSDYIPREGDVIRIKATSRIYGEAEASVIVPNTPTIEDVVYSPVFNERYLLDYEDNFITAIDFDLRINLTIKDDPAFLNYYHYDLDTYPPSSGSGEPYEDIHYCSLSKGNLRYNAEPIFGEHISEVDAVLGADVDGFTFFTDRQFSGAEYRMNLYYTGAQALVLDNSDDISNNNSVEIDNLTDVGFIICLSSVSESYYKWFNYAWQAYSGSIGDLSQIGLADPIRGYSNVSTGAGVVAARSVTRIKIPMDDFLNLYLKNEQNN